MLKNMVGTGVAALLTTMSVVGTALPVQAAEVKNPRSIAETNASIINKEMGWDFDLWAFDWNNQVTDSVPKISVSNRFPDERPVYATEYTYDANGMPARETIHYVDYDEEDQKTYHYDEAGRLNLITSYSGAAEYNASTEISYADFDKNGNPHTAYIKTDGDEEISVGEGAVTIYYDSLGRVRQVNQIFTSDSEFVAGTEKASVYTYQNGYVVNIAETRITVDDTSEKNRLNVNYKLEYHDNEMLFSNYLQSNTPGSSIWDETNYFYAENEEGKDQPTGYRVYTDGRRIGEEGVATTTTQELQY